MPQARTIGERIPTRSEAPARVHERRPDRPFLRAALLWSHQLHEPERCDCAMYTYAPQIGDLRQAPAPGPQPPVTLAMRPLVAVVGGFAFDRALVRGPGARKIEEVAKRVVASFASSQPVGTIRLVGHTDSVGSAAHNRQLGTLRAVAVRNELVRVIDRMGPGLSTRLAFVVASAGETFPVESNRSARGRMLNRRVDVFLSAASVPRVPPPPPLIPSPEDAARRIVPEPRPETLEERLDRLLKTYPRLEKTPGTPLGKAILVKLDAELARRRLPAFARRAILRAVGSGSEKLLEQVMGVAGLDAQTKEAVRQIIKGMLGRPL
jgi:outer membrane protein OmpA-like peptidoglycan-associated protein